MLHRLSCVPESDEPGWATVTGIWLVIDFQDTPDSVFIHIQSKGQIDLLGNARASVSRVVPFHLDDGIDYCLGRAFWPGLLPLRGEYSARYLRFISAW